MLDDIYGNINKIRTKTLEAIQIGKNYKYEDESIYTREEVELYRAKYKEMSDTDYETLKSYYNGETSLGTSDVSISSGSEANIFDKIFYKIDKSLQNGLVAVNKYFSKNVILVDDLMTYETVTPNITDLFKQRAELTSLMKEGALFSKIADKRAPVLVGFDMKLSEGVRVIYGNQMYVRPLEEILAKFNGMLDDFINSKKDSINLSIDTSDVKALDRATGSINKDLSKVTNKKVISDRKPVKALVKNFTDLKEVADELLKLGTVYNMEKLEHLNEMNATIAMKLDIIYNSVKTDKLVIDKKTMEEFVNYITVIAKYNTAVAFLFYFYYQLINMTLGIIKLATITKEDHTVIDTIGVYLKNNYNNIVNFMK